MRRYLACFFVMLAAPALAVEDRPVPQMTVQATASVEALPDIAVLQIGVVSERKSAAETSAENARQSQAVIAELRGAGIEARDIQTQSVMLTPVYDEDRDPNGRARARSLRGYMARNSVKVRLRDIAKAGALSQRLIDRGANQLDGIAFEVSDRSAKLEGARLTALREAQRRAQTYAETLGLKLGRILQIEPDGGSNGGLPAPMAMRAAATESAAPIPLEPGAQTIAAQVSVTFELIQP